MFPCSLFPRVSSHLIAACYLFLWDSIVLAAKPNDLPRFTEEREAAALFFVKKHCPELLPLLEDLQKNARTQYETEIREIFQVTEYLADLQEEPKLYELELRFWKTETKALALVAKLTACVKEEDKKTFQQQLQELAKELVDLEVQYLDRQAQDLEKDLKETREELTKLQENLDKSVKERYESLLEKVKKRKKTR